jgi:hypothetical protein
VLGCGNDEEQAGEDQGHALGDMAGDAQAVDQPAAAGAVKVEELLLEP